MQKVKIILVNLILLLILFHVVDFYCSTIEPLASWYYGNYKGLKIVQYIKKYKLFHYNSIKFDSKKSNIMSDMYAKLDGNKHCRIYRPIENKDSKNAILIFGCSFAYSDYLTEQETFSYNLGKSLPNYAIYNRGHSGWTTSHMLYQLENKDFSNVKNLKYVIYVFMADHFSRNQHNHIPMQTPYYKNTKYDVVKFQKYTLKYCISPVIDYIRIKMQYELYKDLYGNKMTKKSKSTIELTKNIILFSKAITDYKYSGTKFIVLRYDSGKLEPYDYMFEELKKSGIIVLSVNDLSTTDYNTIPYRISKTDIHPNAKAWREITPLFVKYMQDRGYLKD